MFAVERHALTDLRSQFSGGGQNEGTSLIRPGTLSFG